MMEETIGMLLCMFGGCFFAFFGMFVLAFACTIFEGIVIVLYFAANALGLLFAAIRSLF